MDTLRALFSEVGEVEDIKLPGSPESAESRGAVRLTFRTAEAAAVALQKYADVVVLGRRLHVSHAAADPGDRHDGAVTTAVGRRPHSRLPDAARMPASTQRMGQQLAATSQHSLLSHPAVSRCLVLDNLVDPGDVDESLTSEVAEECSSYGIVERVWVEVVDGRVRVHVLFVDSVTSFIAQKRLHGRRFAGRSVAASFIDVRR